MGDGAGNPISTQGSSSPGWGIDPTSPTPANSPRGSPRLHSPFKKVRSEAVDVPVTPIPPDQDDLFLNPDLPSARRTLYEGQWLSSGAGIGRRPFEFRGGLELNKAFGYGRGAGPVFPDPFRPTGSNSPDPFRPASAAPTASAAPSAPVPPAATTASSARVNRYPPKVHHQR